MRLAAPGVAILALVTAGCGDGNGDGDAGGGVENVRVVTPFPGAIPFFPLYVADELDYFADEDLDVTVETTGGGAEVIQQIVGGNAQVGLAGHGAVLDAVDQGEDIVAFYTFTQRSPFALVTKADAGISELADLDGLSVGVDSFTNGGLPIFQRQLADAGIEINLIEVGRAGQAGVALDEDRVAAYYASVFDHLGLASADVDVEEVDLGEIQSFGDTSYVTTRSYFEENRDTLVALARATAQATAFGIENPQAVLSILGEQFPEETADAEAARGELDLTLELREPIPAAAGTWGFNNRQAWIAQASALIEDEEAAEEIALSAFTDELLDQINDFDEAAVADEADEFGS